VGNVAGYMFYCTTCKAEIFRYTGGAGKTTADWKLNTVSNTNTRSLQFGESQGSMYALMRSSTDHGLLRFS
jgi:hypothetical protein